MRQSKLLKKQVVFFFQKAKRLVFGMNFWLFYLMIIVLSFFQNGVWYSPQTELLLQISKDIFKNPFLDQPGNQWLLTSFLGPFLGHFTSMNQSLFSYSLMHLIIFVVFFTILIIAIRYQYKDFIARCVLIIFFLSPISNVLFTWLGSPDILTILLSMTIVVFWNNSIVLLISALLLGINHPEQGLIILLLLTILSFFTRRKQEAIKFALIGFNSLILGILLIQWYFNSHNYAIGYDRVDFFLNTGLFQFIKGTLSNPFALLFSLYNVLIIFISTFVLYFWKKDRICLGFVICSLLAFITILITYDQTRVFSILTFPALLLLVLSPSFRNLESAEKEFFKNILMMSLLVGIVVPRFVVFMGNTYYSAYKNLFNFIHDFGSRLLLR